MRMADTIFTMRIAILSCLNNVEIMCHNNVVKAKVAEDKYIQSVFQQFLRKLSYHGAIFCLKDDLHTNNKY